MSTAHEMRTNSQRRPIFLRRPAFHYADSQGRTQVRNLEVKSVESIKMSMPKVFSQKNLNIST
jgi:hypothetical protein